MLKTVLVALALALFGFAAITLVALEGNEVAVLKTRSGDGSVRSTRVWVADDGGAAWVEAATRERPFYVDLLADPALDVVRGGSTRSCRAVLIANPEGHERIRRLLGRKYGWADVWVGLLTDTSASWALRLDSAEPGPSGSDLDDPKP